MALYSGLLPVTLTMVLSNPVFFAAANMSAINVHGPLQPAVHEDTATPTERLEVAGVDFCYQGIVVDAETEEATELYAPCSEDAIEGNLDLA